MVSSKFKRVLLGAAAAGVAIGAVPANAVNITLRPDASFTGQANGNQALFAFQKAANFWNQFLDGNTSISFNVSYRALNPGVIAQAGSTRADVFTANVYSALAANSGTALDTVAVTNLVKLTDAGGLGYRLPAPVTPNTETPGVHLGLNTTAGTVFDNDDTLNNRQLYGNTALLRELGFTADFQGSSIVGVSDASITFSSAFNFDFDPTDGISVGTQDFVGVAIHEMGHALGFVSGTDFYDFYGGNPAAGGTRGPGFEAGLGINWDDQSLLSVWDLFRKSTNPASNGGFYTDPDDPNFGTRFLQLGTRAAAFSIDGENFYNARNPAEAGFANLSTGRYNGDGQQASHWKDETGFFEENGCFTSDRQIGIMDPTSGTCQLGVITANDLAAFDAMGYNVNDLLAGDLLTNRGFTYTSAGAFRLAGLAAVPEPATWGMMIAGVGLVGGALRRRRGQAVRTTISFG